VKRIALPLGLILIAGCPKDAASPVEGGKVRPVVVASIFPLYDLVRRVGGDAIEAKLLLEPGKSEHDYAGTAKDAKAVANAKLAFLIGLEMDDWTAKIVSASGGQAKIVALGERAGAKEIELPRFEEEHEDEHEGEHEEEGEHHEEEEEEEHHHDHEGVDPHVWLSVPKAQVLVREIEKELSAAFPADTMVFQKNSLALVNSLEALHKELKEKIGALPNKSIITMHGSFGYFAEEYGVQIAAVVEPSPGKEPSAAYLKQILTSVSSKKPVAVFSEPQLDPRPAEVLAKEASLTVRTLDPIGGMAGRESYEALMRYNASSLAGTP
jgi:zinc transport system substrate-binding protein